MALNIFSFQRAFTAQQRMACAVDDEVSLKVEAEDLLDCLHLGLTCCVIEHGVSDNSNNSTSSTEEFIVTCKTILQKLSNEMENTRVSIPLSNTKGIELKEEDGDIQMDMDGIQVTLPDLTIQGLYKKLMFDVQNNPDLYGKELASYASNLKPCEEIYAALN